MAQELARVYIETETDSFNFFTDRLIHRSISSKFYFHR
jgi:hypothetical protein